MISMKIYERQWLINVHLGGFQDEDKCQYNLDCELVIASNFFDEKWLTYWAIFYFFCRAAFAAAESFPVEVMDT